MSKTIDDQIKYIDGEARSGNRTMCNRHVDEFNWLHCRYENNSKSQELATHIKEKIQQLSHHEIYSQLTSTARIECFMSYHIFAVWDFVKLLKPLQNKMTIALRGEFSECPSEMNRLINEIVFTEESDLYPYGQPNEDFAIYLRALAEIEVDPDCLWQFLESQDNLDLLKPGIKELVEFNSIIAKSGTTAEIMAAYLFGREKQTSQLFTSIIKVLKQSGKECPNLISYPEKLGQKNHPKSELTGGNAEVSSVGGNAEFTSACSTPTRRAPSTPVLTAFQLVNYFCQDENEKIRALQVGLEALDLREKLWNYALEDLAEIT